LVRLGSLARRGLIYWVPLIVLCGALATRIVAPHALERFSLSAFDLYQHLHPRPASADPAATVVDIDETSLKRIGQWPWPRSVLARLADKLREAGAGVVAFDVLLSEPDRTSPQALLQMLTERGAGEAAATALLAGTPDPDMQLAQAMAKAPVVVGFSLTQAGGRPESAIKAGFAVLGGKGEDPYRFVRSFPDAVSALPQFEAAARGNGFVNEFSDWDNVVRRVPMVLRLGNRPVPSLAAEALRVGLGARGYVIRYAGAHGAMSFGENSGIDAIEIPIPGRGGLRIPLDAAGEVAVYFAGQNPSAISAADILDGNFDAKRIADHIVLIGASAAGLNDLKATPLSPVMPGVEVHAELIDQILAQDFLVRPDLAPGGEIVFAFLVGTLLIVAIPRFGALPGALIAAAAALAAAGAAWLAFRDGSWLFYGSDIRGQVHVLLDPVFPIAVLAAVYLTSTLLSYRLTERRQREIRQAFSLYMSPHYVDQLARNPEKLVLGGETRLMTIMFCDIRGFTTLSEGMSAHELGTLINDFLTPMTEIVMAHRGTIDKYIGDCIMAFWNAPIEDPHHARNAVDAACAMRRKLAELNADWGSRGRRPLHIGIGINTGECSVGNFGSHQRFNYSLLGDPVNLASRLEGLTKLYGVDLIIGEETARVLADPDLIELDLVAVKGKKNAVRIYTLPPHKVEAPQYLVRHAALLAAYRKGDWQGALALVDDPVIAAERDMTGLYDLFRERIAQMQTEAPPADWDGVFVAHEK
jgi:adenylate cyclase